MDEEAKQQITSTHRNLIASAENAGVASMLVAKPLSGRAPCLCRGDTMGYPRTALPDPLDMITSASQTSPEESPLTSPTLPGLPVNFGQVAPGIFRSSYPQAINLEHLEPLGLKTVVALVQAQEGSTKYHEFITANGIRHVEVQIPAHKEAADSIPMPLMRQVLDVLMDETNRPVLVHCNKGKHRTGCVVACYRKLNHWPMAAIVEEYRMYAGGKARVLDEKYIELFNHDDMRATMGLATPPGSI